VDVYLGGDRVLTGSARVEREAQERAAATLNEQDHQRKLRQLASKRKAIDARIAALQAEADADTEEVHFVIAQENLQEKATHLNADAMAQQRGGTPVGAGGNPIGGNGAGGNGFGATKAKR
jgi:circadian clock protein KaiC